jgi:methyl-accepting chemotaxis protein
MNKGTEALNEDIVMVKETGSSFEEIVTMIKKVLEQSTNVPATTEEQFATIDIVVRFKTVISSMKGYRTV